MKHITLAVLILLASCKQKACDYQQLPDNTEIVLSNIIDTSHVFTSADYISVYAYGKLYFTGSSFDSNKYAALWVPKADSCELKQSITNFINLKR